MALSEMAARKAKATGKAYSLADYDGLSLFVTYKGGNSWHFRYYWAGKPARISLGTYPEVTLHDARALRDEARALVAKGLNPRTDRKRKQLAAMLTGEHRSEEHTSELQSLMRISYAVFCLKTKRRPRIPTESLPRTETNTHKIKTT